MVMGLTVYIGKEAWQCRHDEGKVVAEGKSDAPALLPYSPSVATGNTAGIAIAQARGSLAVGHSFGSSVLSY